MGKTAYINPKTYQEVMDSIRKEQKYITNDKISISNLIIDFNFNLVKVLKDLCGNDSYTKKNIIIDNVVFLWNFTIANLSLYQIIELRNCHFKNGFNIHDVVFDDRFILNKCTINNTTLNSTSIIKCEFHNTFSLYSVSIDADFFFENIVFKQESDFQDVSMSCVLFKNIIFYKDQDFRLCKFPVPVKKSLSYSTISFSECQFEGQVDFSKVVFSVPIIFSHISFCNIVSFNNSVFEEAFLLKDIKNSHYFNFYNVVFKGHTTISRLNNDQGIETNMNFENSRFESEAYFFNCYGNICLKLTQCQFSKRTELNYLSITEINLTYSEIKEVLIIRDIYNFEQLTQPLPFMIFLMNNIIIYPDAVIYLQNIHYKFPQMPVIIHIHLMSSIIKGLVYMENCNIQTLNLKGTIVMGSIYQKNINICANGNRETERMLKKEALKANDRITAQIHYRNEMRAYNQELKANAQKYVSRERLLLLLNRWSNDFGTNWWRGVCFTVIVSAVFTGIYMRINGNLYFTFNTNWEQIGIYWKEVLTFLWIFNIPQKETLMEMNIFALIFYIIGKIFVGYGIYQTIAAFRKHGKLSN